MKTKGKFIFKGVKHRDGGKFVNQQGQEISYNDSYQVKFDEVDENNECFERTVKVSKDEIDLVNKLNRLEIYKPVILEFEVGFNTKGITLKLIDAQVPSAKNSAE